MALATKFNQSPPGVKRFARGNSKAVWLVSALNPLIHDSETNKLKALLSKADQKKPYWVFSFPESYNSIASKARTMTIPGIHSVKSAVFDDYDDAVDQYETWAKGDAKLASVKKGFDGIMQIGKLD